MRCQKLNALTGRETFLVDGKNLEYCDGGGFFSIYTDIHKKRAVKISHRKTPIPVSKRRVEKSYKILEKSINHSLLLPQKVFQKKHPKNNHTATWIEQPFFTAIGTLPNPFNEKENNSFAKDIREIEGLRDTVGLLIEGILYMARKHNKIPDIGGKNNFIYSLGGSGALIDTYPILNNDTCSMAARPVFYAQATVHKMQEILGMPQTKPFPTSTYVRIKEWGVKRALKIIES
jgi:hypothetical protein